MKQSETPGGTLVPCKRIDRERTVSQHLSCPYCFGGPAEVLRGDRRRFCDFEPGKDPVCFGFPETHGRMRRS